MLRSLFSAISGLRANQTMLDVTGNNIANANTVGFKASNVLFQDTLSQMLTAGAAPAGAQGGQNPMQIGLGVQVGGVTTNFNQGSAQVTNRPTNLMISGDGFFVVHRGGQDIFTRNGAFNFDSAGNLVTVDGDMVSGYPAVDGVLDLSKEARGPINIKAIVDETSGLRSYQIGNDGVILGVFDDGEPPRALAQIAMANFANPEGLVKVGDTSFREGPSSGGADIGTAGTGRRGQLMSGSLEMSNVDLAQEFTNLIIAQRGFQATSRVITTSDQVLEELVNIKR